MLKIIIYAKARKNLANVAIRDRIPHLAELHERYGTARPTNVDKQRKILEWEIKEMKKGEEQIFSYVIYSKVSIIGSYQLSNAFATFDINGKTKNSSSNRVIFMSEEHLPS